MDVYRFFVPDLLPRMGEASIALPDDEAHHARAVLRLDAGAPVILFDGRGHWVEARIAHAGKREMSAVASGGVHSQPAPAVGLTLATAIPKGERADWLVEQASQLDVAAIQWLDTDRSVVKPRGRGTGGEDAGGKIAKWRRLAVESAKQCGRAHLLEIREAQGLAAAVEQARAEAIAWLEPREGPASRPLAALLDELRPAALTALIGPEGGWSPREFTLLEEMAALPGGRVHRVRLARTVLRIETACAAAAAIVQGRG